MQKRCRRMGKGCGYFINELKMTNLSVRSVCGGCGLGGRSSRVSHAVLLQHLQHHTITYTGGMVSGCGSRCGLSVRDTLLSVLVCTFICCLLFLFSVLRRRSNLGSR